TPPLALALLVPGILTNHAHISVAPNYFALSANALNRCSHFHLNNSFPQASASYTLRLGPVGDAAPCQIVWRKLDRDFITRQDANEMHAHFSGDMGENAMAVRQFDAKHGIGKGL